MKKLLGAVALVVLWSGLAKADSTTWGLKVDPSGVTSPISGTVTAAQTDPTALRSSVSINGSSNTVTQGPAGTASWLVKSSFTYTNIATNATTLAKTGAGILHTIVVNTRGTGSTATIYDNIVGSGPKIATIDTTVSTMTFVYDVSFSSGCTVVTAGSGAADVTVTSQ